MPKRTHRTWVLNTVLAVSATLMSLVAAEYVLRRINIVDTLYHLALRVPHPVLGWRLMPNVSYVNTYADYPVDVVYNVDGWRDVLHAKEKPPGIFRVLILGDSFMEAYSVDIDDSFSRRLEHSLSRGGRNVEVVNLGVGGYGTLQEYLAYMEYGKSYKPDLVLLMFFFGNDLSDNSYLFNACRKGDALKIISRPYLDPTTTPDEWKIIQPDYERAMQIYRDELEYQNTLRSTLAMRSTLLYGLRMMYGKMNSALKSYYTKAQDPPLTIKNPEQPEHGRTDEKGERCTPTPWRQSAWEATVRILKKTKEEVEAEHSRLLVASVPSIREVEYKENSTSNARGGDEAGERQNVEADYLRLEKILNKLNIDYIDLLKPFREIARTGNVELFGLRDKHWSANGHSYASTLVSEEILRRIAKGDR